MPSEAAIQQVWMLSLALFAGVVVVVAVLLTLILREARLIHAGAAAIWTAGQQVANNTIHLALLIRANHLARGILDAAVGTLGAVSHLERHARTCPRCPTCVHDGGSDRRAS